jgi:hypothetical protein
MVLTVKHSFINPIADVPADLTAGKVTPSRWNADHVITGNVSQEWVAGEVLSALKVVRGQGGQAFLMDASDIAQAHLCVGITETSAASGGAVQVINDGVITDGSWTWTAGPVYLGEDGALTQTVPASPGQAFNLRVGTAVSATRLVVKIDRPIKL